MVQRLFAGFHSEDITPEPGSCMPGGAARTCAKGVHDRLLVSTALFFDGLKTILLIGFDGASISQTMANDVKQQISAIKGLGETGLVIGANDLHTGGPVMDCFENPSDLEYQRELISKTVLCVRKAWDKKTECQFCVSQTEAPGWTFNRRFMMNDGREITHPGKPGTTHHENIVQAAGPVDATIGLLSVRNLDGQFLGTVVNFACHATIATGDEISADYIGAWRKRFKEIMGDRHEFVFLMGATGDVTQVDNFSRENEFGESHYTKMGYDLAEKTASAIKKMTFPGMPAGNTISFLSEEIVLDRRRPREWKIEQPAYGLGSQELFSKIYPEERKAIELLLDSQPSVQTDIQALKIGSLAMVISGAELMCEYGIKIKKASDFKNIWVVTMANDYIGYIPTPQAFAGGGYEVMTSRYSQFIPESGQKILEVSLRLLHKLKSSD